MLLLRRRPVEGLPTIVGGIGDGDMFCSIIFDP